MNHQTIQAIITNFIQTALPDEEVELNVSTPLLQTGVIDSLTLFKLIAHLQQACGVKIKPHEITPENFATISAIESLLISKGVNHAGG